jgi:hypothetical protein
LDVQDLGHIRPREDMMAPLDPLREAEGRKERSQIAETDVGVCRALENPPVYRFAHPLIISSVWQ